MLKPILVYSATEEVTGPNYTGGTETLIHEQKVAHKRRRLTRRGRKGQEKMKQKRDLKIRFVRWWSRQAIKFAASKMTAIGLLTCFDIVIRFRSTSCIFIQEGFLHNALCALQLHRSVMPQCTPTISQPICWTFVLHWKLQNIQQTVIRCLSNHMVCRLSNCLHLQYRTNFGWIHDLNILSCLANLSKGHRPSVYSAVTLQALKWINVPKVVSSYTGAKGYCWCVLERGT